MDDILNSLVGDSRRAVPGLLQSLKAQRTVLEDRVSRSLGQRALHVVLNGDCASVKSLDTLRS